MLSHEPEVSRLLHHEHTERLALDAQQPMQDAQQPMQSVSLPTRPSVQMLSRLATLFRVAVAVRPRRLYGRL